MPGTDATGGLVVLPGPLRRLHGAVPVPAPRAKRVPSFCNYARSFGQTTECTLEQTITTQQRMFARRGIEQTEDDIALLGAVYDLTRQDRCWTTDPPVL